MSEQLYPVWLIVREGKPLLATVAETADQARQICVAPGGGAPSGRALDEAWQIWAREGFRPKLAVLSLKVNSNFVVGGAT